MATMLGSLLISLGLESGTFKSGLSNVEKEIKATTRRVERMGQKIGDIGAKMSVGVTVPLVALAKKSVEGFVDQERAMADVESALRSMGSASGKTSKELSKTADAIEMRSLYDADLILKQVTANLLTFGNVAGREFDRAQQAAVDMATRLGGEPQAAAIMLGKALNSPVEGISALTRVGVQFTEQQKRQIKAMTEAGDVAGAQGIILEEVEKQFKGAAEAAADATPWRKAQVAIGQAMDVIGEAILPIIEPVAEAIASMARAFANLSEPKQKAGVNGAALAAALGPVLMVVGPLVSAMAPFIGTLKVIGAQQGAMAAIRGGIVGIASAFGPMIAVAGIAYAVWKNWDDIAPRLQPLIDQLTAIGEGLGLLEVDASKTQAELAKDDGWRQFGVKLRETSDWLQKAADDFDAYNARSAKAARENGTTIQAGFQKAGAAISNWWNNTKAIFGETIAGFANMGVSAVASVNRMVNDIKSALIGRLSAVWESAKAKVEEVRETFFNLWDKVTRRSYIPDMVDDIAREIARLDTVMVDRSVKAADRVMERMKRLRDDLGPLLRELYPESGALADRDQRYAVIDQAVKDGKYTKAEGDVLKSRADTLLPGYQKPTDWNVRLKDPGPIGVAADIRKSIEDVTAAIPDLAKKAEVTTVRVAESFKDMAEKAMQSLSELAQAIKGGGFLDILSAALNFGLQLGSMGVFGKQFAANLNKVPAYAGGTNFHPGGMALVGERGPELVNLPRGSQVFSNRESMAMGVTRIQVDASPYFDVRVDGRATAVAAPMAMQAAGVGSAGAQMSLARSRKRSMA